MKKENNSIMQDYIQKEIEKMQKTVEGLQTMIEKQDPKKDAELINDLRKSQSITLKNIDSKKEELQTLYNKDIEQNNT